MKKIGAISVLTSISLILILFSFNLSCKKETLKETYVKAIPIVESEIDVRKIEDLVGVSFKILKIDVVGYMPLHKFYWVCLQKKISNQKVEELAHEIIKEIIAKKPETYHSFTIHFFYEDELAETVENSKSFARTTFLPEGSWLKVGRVPIDDYKTYKLSCTFFK